MIDNWTPQHEDIEWTEQHIGTMAIGDTWTVSGALIEKTAEDTLALRQYPAESSLAIERVAKVCAEIGITFNVEEAQLIADPLEAAQDAAKQWADPESGIPLVNFDLENAEWTVNVVPSQDETASTILIDQWTVRITHESEEGDAHEVFMTPMDYHLIAGDDLFFSWQGYRVIEREEAIRLADNDSLIPMLQDGTVILFGTKHGKMAVPPHMRGMLVSGNTNLGEEE